MLLTETSSDPEKRVDSVMNEAAHHCNDQDTGLAVP